MSKKILCAANISEGRVKEVIEALASSIAAVDGITLLDVDPSPTANRTVYNFAGSPCAVIEAALSVARATAQLVDMTRHKGLQPRLGALDACPFVPIKNASLEDCIECAKTFGSKLAEELGAPVYLYGAAASPDREAVLQEIRMEEYESLPEKLQQPEWAPDYGPSDFVPQWGATMVGARKFLVCFHVNLLATKEQATRIALNIREEGRGTDEPGRLKEVQAGGWYLEEHNIAQVTTTITDFEVTPLHVVFEEVRKDAEELNLGVVGAQIVGVIPLRAILLTADHYIEKENLFILEEDQKIRLVVQRLGLNSLSAFVAKERIIEHIIEEDSTDGPLISLSLKDFVLTVGSRTVTPGGGSVAALQGALGAALSTMAALLTFGNRKFEDLDGTMRRLLPPLYSSTRRLIPEIDDDALLKYDFARINAVTPSNDEEKEGKAELERLALNRCVEAPLNLAHQMDDLWPIVTDLAKVANIEHRSDLQVAVKTIEAAVWGAHFSLEESLDRLEDEDEKAKTKAEMDDILKRSIESAQQTLDILSGREADKKE